MTRDIRMKGALQEGKRSLPAGGVDGRCDEVRRRVEVRRKSQRVSAGQEEGRGGGGDAGCRWIELWRSVVETRWICGGGGRRVRVEYGGSRLSDDHEDSGRLVGG